MTPTTKMLRNSRLTLSLAAVALAGTFGFSPARAQNAPMPAAPAAAPKPPMPAAPTDVAAPKMAKSGNGEMDAHFKQKHEEFLKRGKSGPIGVLFLGDSITEGWLGRGKTVWEARYGKDEPANFGISGDRTEHVIWRIANGEFDGIHPKVVVLMIGTNNIGATAYDILKGDLEIIYQIHSRLPDTKLLLLGIFPRGADPKNPGVAFMRDKIKAVNYGLSLKDNGNSVRYLDIGQKFLNADGTLSPDIMPDALHPNQAGYVIWADSMQPLLDQMLK